MSQPQAHQSVTDVTDVVDRWEEGVCNRDRDTPEVRTGSTARPEVGVATRDLIKNSVRTVEKFNLGDDHEVLMNKTRQHAF